MQSRKKKPTHRWLVKADGSYLSELHLSRMTLGSCWTYVQSEAVSFDTSKLARGIAAQLVTVDRVRVVRVRAR